MLDPQMVKVVSVQKGRALPVQALGQPMVRLLPKP